LPSVKKKTLGKEPLCRVLKKTLGKGGFAECPKNNTRETTWHSAKSQSPVVCMSHDSSQKAKNKERRRERKKETVH